MLQRFLDYIAIERKYSPRTVETYGDDLREFCEFMATNEDFAREVAVPGNAKAWQLVGEDDVRMWVFSLTEGGTDRKKNSPRSVHQKLSALRSFYKYLLQQGIVSRDVTCRVMLPKVDKPLPKFFKPHEMEAFESNVEEPLRSMSKEDLDIPFEELRDALIIEVLYQTGMRQAELLGLKDTDWNLSQGSVRIFGKRRKERIVPIGDALIAQIRDYLAAREEWLCGEQAPAFFVRRNRKDDLLPLSSDTLYKIVRTRMGEVSTQKKRSPHVLRHTFATTMLNNGADIRTIQTLLGHASLRATQIYTHATFKQMQDVYDKAHPRARQK